MSNVLTDSDANLFNALYSQLLCYVKNQSEHLRSDTVFPEQVIDLPMKERMAIRTELFGYQDYFDSFIASEEAKGLTDEKRAIVKSWKHFVKGRFFIYKHLKNYSIFLDDSKNERAFAVSGIFQPLDTMFGPPPNMVEAILIPFKDRIIYDGLINGYSIYFGAGIRRNLRDSYEKAKHNFGIIEQLPFEKNKTDETDDFSTLKFYMKNKSNREQYKNEIAALASKNKQLMNLFYQETGKANSSFYSKQLKHLGLEKRWFGIIDNVVVASGMSQSQLEQNLKEVIPEDKIAQAYLFRT